MRTSKHKSLHLPILIDQDEDGVYIVSYRTFKGCHSFGKTVDEALENIKEVIEMCIAEEKPAELNHFIGFREIEFATV